MPVEKTYQEQLLDAIRYERKRQDEKFGAYRDLPDGDWMIIIVEELGETAKAMFELDEDGVQREAIEAAASIVNMLESRKHHKETHNG